MKGALVKRREFLALLGVAAIAGAGTAAAQGRSFKIGFLALGNPDPAPFIKGVREGLRDLGYIEGQNIAFESRSDATRKVFTSPTIIARR